MARKVQVILSDDLDENLSADETVSFSLDGTSYEIDLAEKNAKELRDAFSRYVSAARKARRSPRPRWPQGPRAGRRDPRLGPQERSRGQRPWPHSGQRRRGLRVRAL